MRRILLHLALLVSTLHLVACGHSGGQPGVPGPPVNGPDAPRDLTYGQRIYILEIGEAPAPQTPTVTGTVELYAISPVLPLGMSFDTLSGEIAGAPTVYAARAAYEVTATNFDGTDTVLLLVQTGGESQFAYGGSSSDGTLAEFGVLSPDGELHHRGWIGELNSGVVDVALSANATTLIALDNSNLTTWMIDPATGHLTPAGQIGLGSGEHSLAVHPAGEFLFVSTRELDLLRTYRLDPDTGALSLVSQIITGLKPLQVVADPLGRFLIVRHLYDSTPGNTKTQTRSYTIDLETGDLSTSATFNLLSVEATHMVFGPLGQSLYMTINLPSPLVLHCLVNAVSGKVSTVAATSAGTDPIALSVTPDGKRLYVVNEGSNDVSLFDINSSNGNLTLDTAQATSDGTDGLSFSFDGKELYLVNSMAQEITVQSLNPTSGLFDSSSAIRTRSGSLPLAFLSGELPLVREAVALYVANDGSDDVAAYTIDSADGTLTTAGGAIVAGSTPTDIAVDPRGRFVFNSNRVSNEVITFGIKLDDSLEDLMITTDLAGGEPELLELDPSGRFLYVTQVLFDLGMPSYFLLSYEIEATGSLLALGTETLPGKPSALVVDPTGSLVYALIGENDQVLSYALNPVDGALSSTPGVTASVGFPTALAFDPKGDKAYVTLRDAELVQPYDVNLDGSLSPIGTGSITPLDSLAKHLTLSRDGRFAYVAFEHAATAGGLLMYDVNPANGELYNEPTGDLQWHESVAAGTDPQQVAISPDGLHVYVLAKTSEEVQVFDADATDGVPVFLESHTPGLVPVRLSTLVRLGN
ncbi:MAG: 6-phosphogluconolactonase [Candidatus Paceibacteria bacterium]|jgi:6-phosphogluconolactonase